MSRRKPWKVDYRYRNGPSGRVACPDEDTAIAQALRIKRNMYRGRGAVVVKILNVDEPNRDPAVYVFEDPAEEHSVCDCWHCRNVCDCPDCQSRRLAQ